jgi:hypothetical protein
LTFISKLATLLATQQLGPKFNVIPFMTALDPEQEVLNVVSWSA